MIVFVSFLSSRRGALCIDSKKALYECNYRNDDDEKADRWILTQGRIRGRDERTREVGIDYAVK